MNIDLNNPNCDIEKLLTDFTAYIIINFQYKDPSTGGAQFSARMVGSWIRTRTDGHFHFSDMGLYGDIDPRFKEDAMRLIKAWEAVNLVDDTGEMTNGYRVFCIPYSLVIKTKLAMEKAIKEQIKPD
jgi:hypothetical protein